MIVDRNTDNIYEPEENFFDYSETMELEEDSLDETSREEKEVLNETA